MKISISWLKDFIDFSYSPEELMDIFDSLGLSVVNWEKTNGDTVVELETFPHRFDLLSHLGIARELAAAKNLPWKNWDCVFKESPDSVSTELDIQIRNEALCPRCCGKTVHDVKVGPSPGWMQERLRTLGVSPVDSVNDAVVYNLLAAGQPVHTFDLDKIKGKQLIIRNARPQESLVLRDGREVKLSKEMLVIADEEKTVSLAGIQDDPDKSVSEKTKSVALVAAFFDPETVRKARESIGIQTETSFRYERGTDIDALPRAVEWLSFFLTQQGGNASSGVMDVYPKPRRARTVILRHRKVNEVLGAEVEEKFILSVFQRAGFMIDPHQKESWMIHVPFHRPDVEREADLIEEIGRYYGYDHIPPRFPQVNFYRPRNEKWNKTEESLRQILYHQGFDEVVNDGFMTPRFQELFADRDEAVAVLNPVSPRTSFLKNTLLAGLLENMQLNFSQGIRTLHLFEIGRRFFWESGEIKEKPTLAFAGFGRLDEGHWQRKSHEVDFFHVKGTVEAILKHVGAGPCDFEETDFPLYEPGYSAAVGIKGERIGHLGTIKHSIHMALGLNKSVNAAELDLNLFLNKPYLPKRYNALRMNQGIIREITLIDDQGVRYQEIKTAIRNLNLLGLDSFDVYDRHVGTLSSGEGVSLSLKVIFRYPERNANENEPDENMQKIIHMLKEKFSIQVKGEGGGH
ncbi:MAG: phenylalanine--tRNA ligase subunit beta [Candidatus Aminicenantes bacterium]